MINNHDTVNNGVDNDDEHDDAEDDDENNDGGMSTVTGQQLVASTQHLV